MKRTARADRVLRQARAILAAAMGGWPIEAFVLSWARFIVKANP